MILLPGCSRLRSTFVAARHWTQVSESFQLATAPIERVPRERTVASVEAFQWGWRFGYDAYGIEVVGTAYDPPELVVPVGKPIRFRITSRDVVHSFYVPAFLMKRDAIPGRENRIDLTIDRAGRYRGQCAEFCGLLHSQQLFTVLAVDQSSFDAWIARQLDGREASPLAP